MKVKLQIDWDFFPSLQTKKGHFTGRAHIKKRLINEVIRRDNGAILISGSRGVGKTALVYESIREASAIKEQENLNLTEEISEIIIKRQNKFPYIKITSNKLRKVKILPILINSSQLDLIADNPNKLAESQIVRKEVIVNLIRGLYAAVREADRSKLKYVEKLYKIALATEFRISNENTKTRLQDYSLDTVIKINLTSLVPFFISSLGAIIAFRVIYYASGLIFSIEDIYNLIISYTGSIALFIIVFRGSWKWSKKKHRERILY